MNATLRNEMRTLIFALLIVVMPRFSFGQYKIVKLDIDSTKIYFRYYYISKHFSDEFLNDSIRVVGRKITADKFYLDKFVNKRKIWTRVYSIELAKDSLRITTRSTANNGKSKFEYLKKPYYNSFLMDK